MVTEEVTLILKLDPQFVHLGNGAFECMYGGTRYRQFDWIIFNRHSRTLSTLCSFFLRVPVDIGIPLHRFTTPHESLFCTASEVCNLLSLVPQKLKILLMV